MSIDISSMNSILTSVSNMRGFTTMTRAASRLGAQQRTLNAEIRMDKARGMDTSKKEAQLSKLSESLTALNDSLGISTPNKVTSSNDDEKTTTETEAPSAEDLAQNAADQQSNVVSSLLTPESESSSTSTSSIIDLLA